MLEEYDQYVAQLKSAPLEMALGRATSDAVPIFMSSQQGATTEFGTTALLQYDLAALSVSRQDMLQALGCLPAAPFPGGGGGNLVVASSLQQDGAGMRSLPTNSLLPPVASLGGIDAWSAFGHHQTHQHSQAPVKERSHILFCLAPCGGVTGTSAPSPPGSNFLVPPPEAGNGATPFWWFGCLGYDECKAASSPDMPLTIFVPLLMQHVRSTVHGGVGVASGSRSRLMIDVPLMQPSSSVPPADAPSSGGSNVVLVMDVGGGALPKKRVVVKMLRLRMDHHATPPSTGGWRRFFGNLFGPLLFKSHAATMLLLANEKDARMAAEERLARAEAASQPTHSLGASAHPSGKGGPSNPPRIQRPQSLVNPQQKTGAPSKRPRGVKLSDS